MLDIARHAALAAVAIIAVAVALNLPSAQAQSDEQSGRIVARRLDDGRTEFGWQASGGERVLPSARYFPAGAAVGRWLRSSLVEVAGTEIGRINARLLTDGRIEFAFTPTDGERILPPSRYFPADARAGRWLRSTEITWNDTPRFTAVSAGGSHTCGLRESGAVVCWGDNSVRARNEETWSIEEVYSGQIDAPAGRFSAVSAGGFHTCGLRPSGTVECWGYNASGQTDAPGGSFSAVSAGSSRTCGLRESGAVECWGSNDEGRTDASAGRFTAVSTLGAHTCGLRENGAIECWGWGAFWSEPLHTPAGHFNAVSAGGFHTCGLRENGAIECSAWGDFMSYMGQADVPSGSFSAVSTGEAYACGLRKDTAEIKCWGGSYGWGPYDGRVIPPAGRFTAVSAGWEHTCGLRESGEIECWGDNEYGQANAPIP